MWDYVLDARWDDCLVLLMPEIAEARAVLEGEESREEAEDADNPTPPD